MLCAAGDEKSQKTKNKKIMIFNENVRIPYVRATISGRGKGRIDISKKQIFLRTVRFTQARDTFLPTTEKERKGEKTEKVKKVSKRGKIQIGPQSGTKQSIWRGHQTGLYEVMLVSSQKNDPK